MTHVISADRAKRVSAKLARALNETAAPAIKHNELLDLTARLYGHSTWATLSRAGSNQDHSLADCQVPLDEASARREDQKSVLKALGLSALDAGWVIDRVAPTALGKPFAARTPLIKTLDVARVFPVLEANRDWGTIADWVCPVLSVLTKAERKAVLDLLHRAAEQDPRCAVARLVADLFGFTGADLEPEAMSEDLIPILETPEFEDLGEDDRNAFGALAHECFADAYIAQAPINLSDEDLREIGTTKREAKASSRRDLIKAMQIYAHAAETYDEGGGHCAMKAARLAIELKDKVLAVDMIWAAAEAPATFLEALRFAGEMIKARKLSRSHFDDTTVGEMLDVNEGLLSSAGVDQSIDRRLAPPLPSGEGDSLQRVDVWINLLTDFGWVLEDVNPYASREGAYIGTAVSATGLRVPIFGVAIGRMTERVGEIVSNQAHDLRNHRRAIILRTHHCSWTPNDKGVGGEIRPMFAKLDLEGDAEWVDVALGDGGLDFVVAQATSLADPAGDLIQCWIANPERITNRLAFGFDAEASLTIDPDHVPVSAARRATSEELRKLGGQSSWPAVLLAQDYDTSAPLSAPLH